MEQYRRDRDPRETLFLPGRCVVHFALDDQKIEMCTELKGKKGMADESWFLPFDQGWNDGAGNPPNPYGIKTDYAWRRILTPGGLTDILENYAQIVEQKNEKTGKKKRVQIFPRYHQLDVRRYDRSSYIDIGKSLITIQQGSEDNYKGDFETVNKWAELLKVSHWFGWRDFEDVPDNYVNTVI